MSEVTTSHDEMLEMCIHHGLIYRLKACVKCGRPAWLDVKKRRFRCNWVMVVRK